jgi:hypothetical protein
VSSRVGVSSRVRVAREPSHPITRPAGAVSPLRNRGTPLGEIVADPARGLVYANRGCLHDARGQLRRRYNGRRWIACRLQFRGWQRPGLMMPGRFTELFFLDEATAMAAGHRPCALCRRDDYREFTARWSDLHPGQRGADVIDAQLHEERVDPATGARRRHDPVAAGTLPDGAFVLDRDSGADADAHAHAHADADADADEPWLVLGDALLHWTPGGYDRRRPRPAAAAALEPVTPPSLIELLRTGWSGTVPLLHPSAGRG